VLEIGPGLGVLTSDLLKRVGKVTAIELDDVLAAHLQNRLGGNSRFNLIAGDALQTNLRDVVGVEPVKVVANLPYSVAAAIVQHVLEAEINLVSATIMVQREVGQRLVAEPPDMSILSVATQTYATGSIAFIVPPDVFIPPPTVESAVVHLLPHTEPLVSRDQRDLYFRLVNGGFRHKRKNIANSLEFELRLQKDEIATRLRNAGIDPVRRAQTLSVAEWVNLLHVWTEAGA
ncbi:MAG: 16S rRNA (adenine(1518)-N(6)/adenine(1519)-N(6))-dimethyltransferase RsmA, partial [Chloroflexota bacterium]|nr:16S rRNA (adenine(1518)-N(6)/adenine(1519)-N(6))-dimethyltransferase RsmA [Chloroflexota bacterium]